MSANSPVINMGAGDDVINNSGTITGDVNLDGGVNAFNNLAGGLFNAGTSVSLGADTHVFTNDETFAPGGAGTIQTTLLTGKFVQTKTGIFAVDVDSPSATADRLNVTGSAELAGQVLPTVVNFQSKAQQFTILSAAGNTTNNGISVVDTAAIDYELLFPNPTDMVLSIADINFVPGGGTGGNNNQTSVGQNLNAVVSSGVPAPLQKPISALAKLLTEAELASALDQLLPSPYLDSEIATLFSSLYFTNSLMSCPVREGPAAFIQEGECVWGRVSPLI
jgi:hypothetical protein